MRKGTLALAVSIVIAAALLAPFALAARAGPAACKDGIDNDGDGYKDWPSDPGCSSKNDNSELNPNVQCDDGIDNDGDSAIDYNDAGCSGPTDNDETNCGDGVCEGGETQYNCPQDCGYPDSCSDTDNGVNINVTGTTSGYYNNNPYSNSDYCVGSEAIYEYYCSGSYEQNNYQSCGTDSYGPNYCSGNSVYRNFTDYSCGSGACSSSITPELVETCQYGCSSGSCNPPPDSCSDTDGGFVPEVQGTVSGYDNGQPFSNTDYCETSIILREYSCDGSNPWNWTASCANQTTSCVNGACA